ncbi:oligosaccharide flippase family protein [Maribacter ulvicola]|uniref:Membrane protein involved in the export of O-antigen and teichoic acid n=1 Tax=Maribacter ulvicola TaxID=228959 RepID=A0A1N6VB76_9FLAO|nr:oligosaccharide flippase family protein [Maribacter ulvicola]SIQ75008.1 Membrane protein involved in the export of O-antigen and teichoic acid [Maribacter ulvicola]
MGIVLKQSLNNTIVTYFGFAIGAANTLFLYTNFMQPSNYGLIQVILSVSAVLMPVLAFGVPNSLVKFYSSFKNDQSQNSFLTLMLLLPLLLIIPVAVLSYLANDAIGNLLSRQNDVVKDYVWHIFFVGMAMAYFEVFYAWARIRMKSMFGNFMKEIFCRIGQTILLLLLFFKVIDIEFFINALVGFYLVRTLIMKLYAYRVRKPQLNFTLPKNWKTIIKYSGLIILGGSTAIVLMEVDKVMLNNFLELENVAFYAVAGFIASTIAVPSRAMHQITYPLTATYLNTNDKTALTQLYQKSSLTLFIVSGILFLLILLNLNELYELLPEKYSGGFMIVFWVGLVKVYDALLGNNNSILFNSDYYRSILFFGVLLAVLAILFNLWLIPNYGINGAAIASFSAFFVYNSLKLGYVKAKFKILPFTNETLKVLGLLIVVAAIFSAFNFSFHPFLNIVLKSMLMLVFYVGVLYWFKISEDVYGFLSKYLSR